MTLMWRGALYGLAAAFAAAACVRLFVPVSPAFGSALLAAGAAAGAAAALRALPSRKKWRALADDAARAGGLILVSDMEGASLWPRPPADAVQPPPWRPFRAISALAASAALFLASSFAPPALATASPSGSAVVPEELIAESVEEIRQLEGEAELTEDDLAELREEVERIVADAARRGAAETLDALGRVAERLRSAKALADAERRLAAAAPSMRMDASEFAARQRELSEMLAKSPSSRDTTLDPQQGDCGGGCRDGGDRDGGDRAPGSGDASRGRGDAIISWTDPVQMGDSVNKDIQREADPAKDETTLQGEALGEWDASEMPSAPGAPASAPVFRAVGAGTAQRRVLPRHRDAVRRYFSRNPSERNNDK